MARYIREADFSSDGYRGGGGAVPYAYHRGVVVRLLAESPYLEHAGLNTKKYYDEIEKELQDGNYSQHATAFLLTLLPNIQTITLPTEWKPLYAPVLEAPDKLIDVVVRETKQ